MDSALATIKKMRLLLHNRACVFEGIARAVLQNFTPRSMQPTYRGARTKRSSVPFAKNILNCLVLKFVNRVFPRGAARLAVTSIHGSMQHIAKYAQQFERGLELSNDILLYGARSVVRLISCNRIAAELVLTNNKQNCSRDATIAEQNETSSTRSINAR